MLVSLQGPSLPIVVRRTGRERKPKFSIREGLVQQRSSQQKIPTAAASLPDGEHCLHSVCELHTDDVCSSSVDTWHTGHGINCQQVHKQGTQDKRQCFRSKSKSKIIEEPVVSDSGSAEVSVPVVVRTERDNGSLVGSSAQVYSILSSAGETSQRKPDHKSGIEKDWKDVDCDQVTDTLDVQLRKKKKKKKRRPCREYEGGQVWVPSQDDKEQATKARKSSMHSDHTYRLCCENRR